MSEYTVLEAKLKACWSVGVFMFLHPFVFFLRVRRLSRVCVCACVRVSACAVCVARTDMRGREHLPSNLFMKVTGRL